MICLTNHLRLYAAKCSKGVRKDGTVKSFVSQTRKPEGVLGKMMLKGMNSGHAQMADGMKCHTTEELEKALSVAGFTDTRTDHHSSKPWITVLAKKA